MKLKRLLAIGLVLMLSALLPLSAAAAIDDGLYGHFSFDEDAKDAIGKNNFELKRQDQIVKEDAIIGSGYLEMKGESDVLALEGDKADRRPSRARSFRLPSGFVSIGKASRPASEQCLGSGEISAGTNGGRITSV